MSNDLDEDLIDATIRRIQSQQTGSKDGAEPRGTASASDSVQETPESEYASASMDRIQDTILRVKAQAAAMRAAEADPPSASFEPSGEDPIEATIRRVQAQADAARANEDADGFGVAPETEDEDPIEATIRRVQKQALSQNGPEAQESQAADEAREEQLIEATIRRVQEQSAETEASVPFATDGLAAVDPLDVAIQVAESHLAPDREPVRAGLSANEQPLEETPWPGRDERMLGEPASWEVAAQRLEQGLQDTQREVRSLVSRIEALLPALQQLGSEGPAFSSPSTGPGLKAVPKPEPAVDDDEWDDAPQISRVPFGAPPRPAIFRDPSPQTATAELLVEESEPVAAESAVIRTPLLRAVEDQETREARYPRQYRITVEDKRRGVDLVPLHRAMQNIDNVKDMSLLSYNNGVAIVALESIGAVDPEGLRAAVAQAMSRETKIEVHNEQTMVVKIQDE